jgi:tetratricopeptide (TPR) repeat protein
MAAKPKLFIGSSVEGRSIAYAIQQNLAHEAEITVWNQGVFELSKFAIESLVKIVEASDFGIFVFSPDDIVKMRGAEHSVARDNVVFELGLFIGRIGRERTFLVIPDKQEIHLPTDLLGMTPGKYETERTDSNMEAATGSFCNDVRKAISNLGVLPEHDNIYTQEDSATAQQISDPSTETDWVTDYIEKRYDGAIEKLTKLLPEKDGDEIHDFKIMIIHCQILKETRSGLAALADYLEAHLESLIVWRRVAQTYKYVGQHDLAKSTITRGLEKFPEDPELTLVSAEIHSAQGDIATSITLLRANTSQDTGLILQLCEYLENEAEDKEQALLIIHKAYQSNPTAESIRFKFARLAQENGKNELALFLFYGLKEEFPKNTSYLCYFGNSCLDLELNDLALQTYRAANKLAEEKEGWILSNIGNILKNRGFYEDSKEYFLKSQALDKNSSYMYERMGTTLKLQEEEGKKFEKMRKVGRSEARNAPSFAIEDVASEAVEVSDITIILPSK